MIALLPCPFCGGAAKLDAQWGDCARVEHWCEFSDGKPLSGFIAFEEDTPEQAAARWNTRAALPPVPL